MTKYLPVITFLIALSLHWQAVAAEIYKWRDADGTLQFSDQPPVGMQTEATGIIAEEGAEKRTADNVEQDQHVSRVKVVMYSASWCVYCKQAKKYFAAQKIPFREYDVENSAKGRRDYKALKGRGVPVILIGKKQMNGFDRDEFDRLYQAATS